VLQFEKPWNIEPRTLNGRFALLNPESPLVININSRAGVVEWQTRRTQNPVGAKNDWSR
jgi:hypothetical protein